MKSSFLLFICLAFTWTLSAQNNDQPMDSLSYSLGVMIAKNLQSQGFNELTANDLAKGVEDVIKGNKLAIEPEQADQVINSYMQRKVSEAGQDNLKVGNDFLAKNGSRAEVTTTASGLQYEVITEGDGASPQATDEVSVHYHGTLLDGTVFDSSVERGQPASFPVNRVIAGWVEALQLMQVGDKWKLFIPANLAYGEQGAGGDIGPNETLIFEVELLGIK